MVTFAQPELVVKLDTVQRSAYDHLKGGCESQKHLLHRMVRINPIAQLMCDRQRGSTAKAVISLSPETRVYVSDSSRGEFLALATTIR